MIRVEFQHCKADILTEMPQLITNFARVSDVVQTNMKINIKNKLTSITHDVTFSLSYQVSMRPRHDQ